MNMGGMREVLVKSDELLGFAVAKELRQNFGLVDWYMWNGYA